MLTLSPLAPGSLDPARAPTVGALNTFAEIRLQVQ
jgi:hypothetical protein